MSQPKHKTDVHLMVVKTTDGQKIETLRSERLPIPSNLNIQTAAHLVIKHVAEGGKLKP